MWNTRVQKYYFFNSVLSLFCVFITCNCLEFNADEVTRTMKISLGCHKNPGMAVGVVKNGKLVYSRGFGVTDLATKTPVTDETLFGIASITKSFAGALLVKLLDEKTNLTIYSKVRELLGDEFVMPDDVRTTETTFLDMLAHKTAMLPYNAARYNRNLTRETLLSRLRLMPTVTERQFRVSYLYNNLIYGLVSRIAEIIGGKRWEDLISENFFQPLGMNKSTFATRLDFTRKDIAVGYTDYDGPGIYQRVTPDVSRRWAEMCGSGSILSTVKDMSKWMNFFLSQGQSEEVMKPSLLKQLFRGRYAITESGFYKPQFPITSQHSTYAIGLRRGYYRGYRMINHSGSTYGYSSYMTMLPTEDIGVIILFTNRDTGFLHRYPVQYYLLDQALGIKPWINSTTICSFPKPWKTKYSSSTYRPSPRPDLELKFPLEEYQSVYSNEAFGNLIIQHNTTLNSLVAFYGWGFWEMMLWPKTSDNQTERFYLKGQGPIFPPDVKPLYFVTHPDDENAIVGLKATFLEWRRPPIFCKQDRLKLCEEIVNETYPKKSKTGACPKEKENNAGSMLCNTKILYFVTLITLLKFVGKF